MIKLKKILWLLNAPTSQVGDTAGKLFKAFLDGEKDAKEKLRDFLTLVLFASRFATEVRQKELLTLAYNIEAEILIHQQTLTVGHILREMQQAAIVQQVANTPAEELN